MTRGISILINLLILSLAGTAQIQISSSLDSNVYLIGDQFNLLLEVKHDSLADIRIETIGDTLRNFEVLKQDITNLKEEGRHIRRYRFLLTSFDSGAWVIPAIRFFVMASETGRVDTLASRPIPVLVTNLPVDLSTDIKAIKPPMEAPFSLMDYWEGLLGAGLLFAAILLWYWYKRRDKKVQTIVHVKSAFEIAMENLHALEERKLWQNGAVKEYYVELTEIIRIYIEHRFGIKALESTTAEILADLQSVMMDKNQKQELKLLLELSDFVKFAKAKPLTTQHEQSIKQAFSFLENTRPVVVTEKNEPAHV